MNELYLSWLAFIYNYLQWKALEIILEAHLIIFSH